VIDPEHEQQAGLSHDAPVPMSGPSEVALRLAQESDIPVVQLGQFALVWRRFRRHKLAMVGAVTMVLLILMAILAPLISPETYYGGWDLLAGNKTPRLTYPGASDWKYLLGADGNGHSLLMWVTYGARVSLAVGILAAFVTMVLAILIGATAGYFGGWADAVIMRITDVFLTLPFLPLIILLSAYLAGGSWVMIVVLFGVLTWPGSARLVRGYYLTFREQEFTQAARAVGVSDTRIIFRHILPNALSPIIVATTLAVAGFITVEAAIDFLGIGIRPPSVSWGLALSNADTAFQLGNWWWVVFPGIFLLLTTLAINFMGDGLRDALDVRARAE
jgi:ABC-type dipeptide/oligopeptide/nickel transport system permease subunit